MREQQVLVEAGARPGRFAGLDARPAATSRPAPRSGAHASAVEGQRHQRRARSRRSRGRTGARRGSRNRSRRSCGIDSPPVAMTSRGACTGAARRCRARSRPRRAAHRGRTAHGCHRVTPPASHSRSSISMIRSLESSQNSWPLCFSWQAMPWRSHQLDEIAAACSGPAPSGRSADWPRRSSPARSSRLVKLQRPPPEMRIFSATLAAWSSSSTRRPRCPATPAQSRPAAPAPMMTDVEAQHPLADGLALPAGAPGAARR